MNDPRPPRTAIEQAAYDLFLAAGYQAFGICQNPTCPTRFTPCLTSGRSPRARICIDCFEHVFNNTHPSTRKLEGRRP